MRRREFIAMLGGAAAWPLTARAQQAVPTIGFLSQITREENAEPLKFFHEGLSEQGFVEGRNLRIEYRWADGNYNRIPALAADLVRRDVAVIATTGGDVTALVAQAATKRIPIVFASSTDPVASGLVASLARPGGNLTGVSLLSFQLNLKRLELLREVAPDANPIGLLVNPAGTLVTVITKDVEAAAQSLGRQIKVFHASTEREIEAVVAGLRSAGAGALLISNNAFFNAHCDLFGALALHHRVPAVHQLREFALAGGLMSYRAGFREANRLVGNYTGRILKGEKPSDLPVQQQTKIELVVNLKAAKAIGVTVPTAVLLRADEVIE